MSEVSPEAQVWDLLRGAITSRALGLVCDLRIADALAGGPRPVADLARETGADPDILERILRALASDGIFAEGGTGVYRNTPASELLRTGWGQFAHLFGGVFHRTSGGLKAAGQPVFPTLYGTDFWSWLAENPDERAAFDAAMEQGKERRLGRLESLEWRDDETVIDVGGGNGSFLRELLHVRPGLHGVVLDLPETVRDDAALAAEGIEFVEGSFFETIPAGDSYVLGTILHDWDDERAGAILRTIRAHAPRGSRVLVIDAVIAPGNEPHGAKWLDLLMHALSGGRERTDPEWRALVEGAGLAVESVEDGLIVCRSP